jgi:hypothetical protein
MPAMLAVRALGLAPRLVGAYDSWLWQVHDNLDLMEACYGFRISDDADPCHLPGG